MNNSIFSFERFGKYFCYDLRSAYNRVGLSTFILGLVPVFTFVFSQFLSLLTSREFADLGVGPQISAFATAVVMIIIMAPVKLYGHVTDKRAGSDWLMIPASALEKTLSMLLITCVVLPLAFFAIFFLSDGLLAIIFNSIYPEALISQVGKLFKLMTDNGFVSVSKMALYLSWCENVLIFTLGAICFKKGKVGKTILAIFLFMTVLTSVLGFIVPEINIDNGTILSWIDSLSVEKVQFWMNAVLNVIYLLVFAVLDLGIYFRVKTIKL